MKEFFSPLLTAKSFLKLVTQHHHWPRLLSMLLVVDKKVNFLKPTSRNEVAGNEKMTKKMMCRRARGAINLIMIKRVFLRVRKLLYKLESLRCCKKQHQSYFTQFIVALLLAFSSFLFH